MNTFKINNRSINSRVCLLLSKLVSEVWFMLPEPVNAGFLGVLWVVLLQVGVILAAYDTVNALLPCSHFEREREIFIDMPDELPGVPVAMNEGKLTRGVIA